MTSISTRSARSPRASSQQRPTVLLALAGQCPYVDLELDGVGDHVDLGAAMHDRRRDRRVGAGVELPGHPQRQTVEHLVQTVGRQQRVGDLGWVAHRRDEAAPHLVDLRLGLVLRQPAYDLGRGHQRVVGPVGLRAVARRAVHPQPAPVRALLPDDDGQLEPRRRRDGDAARLGDHVVGADGVGGMVGQPLRPVGAERFLIGDGEVDERAVRSEARLGEVTRRDRHRRGEVEHVDRARVPTPRRRPARRRTDRAPTRRG